MDGLNILVTSASCYRGNFQKGFWKYTEVQYKNVNAIEKLNQEYRAKYNPSFVSGFESCC